MREARKNIFLKSFLIPLCFYFFLPSCFCSAEQTEEVQEAKIRELSNDVIKQKHRDKLIAFSLEVASGFDTNPKLTPVRKGDLFEEVMFSANFQKVVMPNLKITASYDLASQVYNEKTDVGNVLNHGRISSLLKFGKYYLGLGYDFSTFYYPNYQPGDFYYNRGFMSLRRNINARLSHELRYEIGRKDFSHQNALADTSSTYQDSKRYDNRQSLEYGVNYWLTQKLYGNLRTRLSLNNSNSHYQDYYDYRSIDASPQASYMFSKALTVYAFGNFTHKIYDHRMSTTESKKQKDELSTASVGLSYALTATDIFSVLYTRLQAWSNDSTAEYLGSNIKCGIRHLF